MEKLIFLSKLCEELQGMNDREVATALLGAVLDLSEESHKKIMLSVKATKATRWVMSGAADEDAINGRR